MDTIKISYNKSINGDRKKRVALFQTLCIKMMKEHDLKSIGLEVVSMLKSGKFYDIANRYRYALRYDRDAKEVIEEDFRTALNECTGSMQNSNITVSVSHFEVNDTGLESLIECDIQLEQSSGILVELILNTEGTIYLEQISSYRTEHHA